MEGEEGISSRDDKCRLHTQDAEGAHTYVFDIEFTITIVSG